MAFNPLVGSWATDINLLTQLTFSIASGQPRIDEHHSLFHYIRLFPRHRHSPLQILAISLRENVNDVFGVICKRCYQVVPLANTNIKVLVDDKHFYTDYYIGTVVRETSLQKFPTLKKGLY